MDAVARREAERLTAFLWGRRADDASSATFVQAIRSEFVDGLTASEPSLADQREQVERLSAALAADGPLAELDLRGLGGRDGSPEHLNLLTLHSAKGCEYDVVIMVGMDWGCIPWRNEFRGYPAGKPALVLRWAHACSGRSLHALLRLRRNGSRALEFWAFPFRRRTGAAAR